MSVLATFGVLGRDIAIAVLERVELGARSLADRMRTPMERHVRAVAAAEDDDEPPIVSGGSAVTEEALELVARRQAPTAPPPPAPLRGSIEARARAWR